MVDLSRLTRRARRLGLALTAIGALAGALDAGLVVGLGTGLGAGLGTGLFGGAARAQTQAPAAEGAIGRLATLHWQAILLERMTLGACATVAGADPAATAARIEAARNRFDAVLTQLREGFAATITDERTRKQVARGLDDLSAQWWRFRGALDAVTTGRDATPVALAGVHAIDKGMTETVEKLYSGSRRALTKAGETDMGQTMGEYAAYSHVLLAETAVSHACFAGIEGLPEEFRHDAAREIDLFAGEVAKIAQSPFAPPAQKALVARWEAAIPKMQAAARGTSLAPGDLAALGGLLDEWALASDRLGVEQRSGL